MALGVELTKLFKIQKLTNKKNPVWRAGSEVGGSVHRIGLIGVGGFFLIKLVAQMNVFSWISQKYWWQNKDGEGEARLKK